MGIENFDILAAQLAKPAEEKKVSAAEAAPKDDFTITPLEAVSAMRYAMQWMASSGAVDSEYAQVNSWITQVENGQLAPRKALENIQELTASRQDYH